MPFSTMHGRSEYKNIYVITLQPKMNIISTTRLSVDQQHIELRPWLESVSPAATGCSPAVSSVALGLWLQLTFLDNNVMLLQAKNTSLSLFMMHGGSEYNNCHYCVIILQLVEMLAAITVLSALSGCSNLRRACVFMQALQERLCEQDKLRKLSFLCQQSTN